MAHAIRFPASYPCHSALRCSAPHPKRHQSFALSLRFALIAVKHPLTTSAQSGVANGLGHGVRPYPELGWVGCSFLGCKQAAKQKEPGTKRRKIPYSSSTAFHSWCSAQLVLHGVCLVGCRDATRTWLCAILLRLHANLTLAADM